MRVPLTTASVSPVFSPTVPASFARATEVEVLERDGEVVIDVFGQESGGSPLAQPLRTDAAGRIKGQHGETVWVEEGSYDLVVGEQTLPFEAPNSTPVPVIAATTLQTAAVDLIVEKTSGGDPTTGTFPIRIMRRGPTGTLWGQDNSNGLWKSTDDTATWAKIATLTGYTQVEQILELESGFVLLVVRNSESKRFVVRSKNTEAKEFESVFSFPTSPTNYYLLGPASWFQDPADGAIYLGEYNTNADNAHDIHIKKSTDDGATFTTAATFTGSRHIHSVQLDPYEVERQWVCIGDTSGGPRIAYSDNGWSSWVTVVEGEPITRSRAVTLMFTEEAVFWANDDGAQPGEVWKFDRESEEVSLVVSGLNAPFYYSVSVEGRMAVFSAVELASNGYEGDQFVRCLTSDGGAQWATAQQWHCTDSTVGAILAGITDPDAEGRFWVCLQNVDGMPTGGVLNLKCYLSPVKAADRGPDFPTKTLARQPLVTAGDQSGTISANTTRQPFFYVPPGYSFEVVHASLSTLSTIEASESKYWTWTLRRYRAGAVNPNGEAVAQGSGKNVKWTALDLAQPTVFNDGTAGAATRNILKEGDALVARYDKTGEVGNLSGTLMIWGRLIKSLSS